MDPSEFKPPPNYIATSKQSPANVFLFEIFKKTNQVTIFISVGPPRPFLSFFSYLPPLFQFRVWRIGHLGGLKD
ncbi:hypothetical protein ABKV19_019610 [Rosa sericea]